MSDNRGDVVVVSPIPHVGCDFSLVKGSYCVGKPAFLSARWLLFFCGTDYKSFFGGLLVNLHYKWTFTYYVNLSRTFILGLYFLIHLFTSC